MNGRTHVGCHVQRLGKLLRSEASNFDERWGDGLGKRNPDKHYYLSYAELARHVFYTEPEPEFRDIRMWAVVERHAEEVLKNEPLRYPAGRIELWRDIRCSDSLWQDEILGNECLTPAGILFVIEAWCREATLCPATFLPDHHTDLQFWRCKGEDIVRRLFLGTLSSVPSSMSTPEQALAASNDRLASVAAAAAAQTAQLGRQQLKRGPHFSRIQAFGLGDVVVPETGQTTRGAFFLPATQILAHMQKYFRSSSVFDEKKWRDAKSYKDSVMFSNIMLLNLCGEVMTQIATMFRLESNPGRYCDKLCPRSSGMLLVADHLLESDFDTSVTERLLGHSEPRDWMPPISVNLQRFLGGDQAAEEGSAPAPRKRGRPRKIVASQSPVSASGWVSPVAAASSGVPTSSD